MQRTVGIDPGARGAIAVLEGDALTILDMPITMEGAKRKSRVDPAAFAAIIRSFNPEHVWVEQVGALPRQGVSSMFAFGMAYGYARGIPVALGYPVTLVSPASWKSSMRCGVDNARARASQLLPKHAHHWPLAKHDGRAEAALIALYGSTRGIDKGFIEW